MRRLSKPEQYEAFYKVGVLCVLRRDSDKSEEEIAEKLNFGSAESMYIQLKNWGLPDWLVYGEAQQSVSDEAPMQGQKRKPQAKRVGDAMPLPPAEEASFLFKYDVELLHKEIEKLTGREEFLQNRRFTGTRPETFRKYVWRREDFITGEGEEKGKEKWEKLCKEYGKDPADEQIEGDPVFHLALGALQAPAEPLTTLIAVSALIERRVGNKHMQELIKRLHPDSEDLDVERLQKTIEELVTKAAHTATLVRGGKVGAGRPHPIQPREQAAAALINVLQREGWSEDRIIRTVNELHALPGEEFNDEDIDRLKTLHLNRGYW